MHKLFVAALAAATCVLGSSTAFATNLLVTVSETSASGVSQVVASWIQAQNPTPVDYVDNYYTTVTVWDATGLGGDDAVTWYSGTDGQLGGFSNYNENFDVLAPTSYAYPESAPTFVPGTYYGVNLISDSTYLQASYTIAALPDSDVTPAVHRFNLNTPVLPVPEPATWAMIIIGLGMIGLAARPRPKVAITRN